MENEQRDDYKQGFEIDNDSKAEWALNKLKELRCEHDRLVKVCQDMILHYQGKIAEYDQKLKENEKYFIALLNQYFESVPHKEIKTLEKYTLPSGDLILKKPQIKILRPDDESFLPWIKINAPRFIEFKEFIKWGEFKKTLIIDEEQGVVINGETGDAVPVEIQKTDEEFEIKLK